MPRALEFSANYNRFNLMPQKNVTQKTPILRQIGLQAVVSLGVFLLGIYAVIQGLNLGIGDLSRPGAGFTAFLFGGIMAALALLSLTEAYVKEKKSVTPSEFDGGRKKVILIQLLVLASLVGYVYLIPRAGHLISTFLFVTTVSFLISRRVLLAPIVGAGVSLCAYVVFSVLLNVPLPL